MLKIRLTNSYVEAVASAGLEMERNRLLDVEEFFHAAGAAYDRICEQPGLGRALAGGLFSHSLVGFPFAVIYEVTDMEICFLYLAAFSK